MEIILTMSNGNIERITDVENIKYKQDSKIEIRGWIMPTYDTFLTIVDKSDIQSFEIINS